MKQREQVHAMTQESRKQLADALMQLPKEKIIPAMRSAGLDDEANELEQQFAQDHLMELRQQRLAEIYALPEDEQLSLLIGEGYTEEAKELSERLAAETEEEVHDNAAPADVDESPESAEPADNGADAVPEEKAAPEKKKSGRPKKSKK